MIQEESQAHVQHDDLYSDTRALGNGVAREEPVSGNSEPEKQPEALVSRDQIPAEEDGLAPADLAESTPAKDESGQYWLSARIP